MTHAYVVGADASQQELFNFNINQLAGQNVIACDFGWLEIPEGILAIRDFNRSGWYNKPTAILRALHFVDSVTWLDNDIEILDEKWFDHPKKAMGAAWDRPAQNYNTGMVNAVKCDKLFLWEERVAWHDYRSDQEAFPEPDFVIPSEYNRLRLDGWQDSDLARHYTGKGKDELLRRRR